MVLSVLYKEGYINGFRLSSQKSGFVEIFLKYHHGKPAIKKLASPSKPGRRLYLCSKDVWKVQSSMVTYILSTPKGVFSDKDCRKLNCGGEVIGLLY